MKKQDVAVLGGTGMVGQKFVSLLIDHPWFNLVEIGASPASEGQYYGDRVCWQEKQELPENIKNIKIKNCQDEYKAKIMFSALDSSVAGEVEEYYSKHGHYVLSNSKNHRFEKSVPLMIPEVNPEHLELLTSRPKGQGFIITNPNCTTTILTLALAPLHKKLKIEKVMVTTMQAISGAGYPGISAMDISGNVIPYIDGEEEKVETEIKKILGSYDNGKINELDVTISAHCNRVPVVNGHQECLSISFENQTTIEEIKQIFEDFSDSINEADLPSSPKKLYYLFDDPSRPQVKHDVDNGNGMSISIGRVRECSILDYKMVILGHNTVRGAAGGSLLNAEYLYSKGIIK